MGVVSFEICLIVGNECLVKSKTLDVDAQLMSIGTVSPYILLVITLFHTMIDAGGCNIPRGYCVPTLTYIFNCDFTPQISTL